MIEGVELKELQTYPDERSFFREIIRITDSFFEEGFAQWSHSMMYTGTIKAWHIHQKQVDWWYVPVGVVRAVLTDLRWFEGWQSRDDWQEIGEIEYIEYKYQEFILGDNQLPLVLRIPPGVAHGLKVLQGPAHLFYITSNEYDGSDEGRIPHDALGYDWHKEVIK
jgi:dTDP-4-dehydrorhamnose 3,5-epimerase